MEDDTGRGRRIWRGWNRSGLRGQRGFVPGDPPAAVKPNAVIFLGPTLPTLQVKYGHMENRPLYDAT